MRQILDLQTLKQLLSQPLVSRAAAVTVLELSAKEGGLLSPERWFIIDLDPSFVLPPLQHAHPSLLLALLLAEFRLHFSHSKAFLPFVNYSLTLR